MREQALEHLKVLEFGRSISAAFASKLLGDYGAEIIKIEPPGGDEARRHGPFADGVPHPEKSGLFLSLNANKLGVTLDPTIGTGREILLELVRQSDVLMENFLPGELEALGLSPETLMKANPRLVVTSVTAFGKEGPHKDYKGYAINAAAAAGVAHRMGEPGRHPLTTPYDRSDYWGAIHAAGATLVAILAREKTGRGQHADVSSAEVLGSFINSMDIISYLTQGTHHVRQGRRLKIAFPWSILPCKDGFFALINPQDRHWSRFLEIMENPEWAKNPRYQDRRAMGFEYPEESEELLLPWLAQQPKMDLWRKCREARVPFHAVQDLKEVTNCEHLADRGFWHSIEHPDAGVLKYPGAPFKMSATPWTLRFPAPRLGEHNQLVYCGRLGLSTGDLVGLRRGGVI